MLRNINYGENDIIFLTYDNKNNSFDQNIDKGRARFKAYICTKF